jgi:hypothetical protein
MRRLLVPFLFVAAATLSANDRTRTSMQSGGNTTPIHDRGLHGEGQIIAVLDTGADWTNCYLTEPDGRRPPLNLGTASGGLDWQNVDSGRRKIIAYNFLYSCLQYPGARGCDNPDLSQNMASTTNAYDNQGHGTHAATTAAGDRGTPVVSDSGDALATAAKLIIQDGGAIFEGNQLLVDGCSGRPGFGCPVNLMPILDQAYKQGARIHSNSWGDRQGVASGPPPTANYSQSARDLDQFVYEHPDLLVVFNTGNLLDETNFAPPSSLSAPGAAKNALQVGGTRGYENRPDDQLANFSLAGPTRDGRIKPDVVGPASVFAGDAHVFFNNDCAASEAHGTSFASPTIAGAAALVRQYYTDGFYPNGTAGSGTRMTPSAALLKASIIAAARPVPYRSNRSTRFDAEPVPSYQQGFGFPVLDDVLYFSGDRRRLRVYDVAMSAGLTQGETFTTTIDVAAGTPLKAVLVWTDPPGRTAPVTDSAPQLVNDLNLRLTTPSGPAMHGNERLHPGQPDTLNNVEVISIDAPQAGRYTISVSAPRIAVGPRQSYALVLTGDFAAETASRRRAVRR